MSTFTESVVEQAALAWLESAGWQIRNGVAIAPGEPAAERDDYGQVVLAQRLRDALARLNPTLPAEALDDAFRKLARPEGAELVARSRALHRLLVDGVTVEYRRPDGSISHPTFGSSKRSWFSKASPLSASRLSLQSAAAGCDAPAASKCWTGTLDSDWRPWRACTHCASYSCCPRSSSCRSRSQGNGIQGQVQQS